MLLKPYLTPQVGLFWCKDKCIRNTGLQWIFVNPILMTTYLSKMFFSRLLKHQDGFWWDLNSGGISIFVWIQCLIDPRISPPLLPKRPNPQSLSWGTYIWLMLGDRCIQDRDYSFYSHPHDTHTRIDNFLISTQLFHRVLDTEYLSRLLSDHSPLVLSVSIPDKVNGEYRWRLN